MNSPCWLVAGQWSYRVLTEIYLLPHILSTIVKYHNFSGNLAISTKFPEYFISDIIIPFSLTENFHTELFTVRKENQERREHTCCAVLSHVCDPVDRSPPGPSAHGILQGRILEWAAMPSSRGSSWPTHWTQVSCIAGGFFTIWANRQAQEFGAGSLCFLQGIFPTQEANPGLLHCRQIFYQLRFQGRSKMCMQECLLNWKM